MLMSISRNISYSKALERQTLQLSMGAYSTLVEHLNSRLIIIIIITIVNYPNNMNMTMFGISSCRKVFSR